ncbi:ABC transporter ATP-binding protein [Plasticicumulans acidivorans]|uniref:Amino acid/amide ABC transporter ATP-binding protein 2 (HAAT family) n=1 Tax=Plasticicumulans acidivorans TaxID=886464 RepID=A0A317MN20_9GAMM|nr:ABC transporter ATP-binding protein [Plasticicumulans acidivorans]PWV57760.1 amino acid/amide ABC transporter ATP-binding protein 2 (HAAT family) [Plasticicumulans acidivorans]
MLEVNRVRAGYGAINVLWDLSLTIREGEVTAIIGPNGAGKTTLLRAIMGLIPLSQGDIALHGDSLAGRQTWSIARHGISLIPEGRLVFRDMTVEDNLTMGAFPNSRRAGVAHNLARVYELFPRLAERRRQLAGALSGGEAQMVAIGRGLMAEPSVLLVDEPSLGLAPVMVQEIFGILERLKAEGRTIVLVEQNTHLALSLADHVHLMQAGRLLLSEPAPRVDLQRLHDLYFAR